ncbi:MAG: methylenetetrahydrofolate reductase [NAD(P)H] [Verrucomicrobiales bacterium]|nr:methylenetetrahydrofolate reductase [NAD(P)H] [Verrucomicrobiales bacterium]
MRLIKDIHSDKELLGKPTISFEFFPFKTPEGEVRFFEETLPSLMGSRPDYASVTYGAGGSTREKTFEIVAKIQGDFGLPTIAHLTCVKHTIDEINSILDDAKKLGVRNILALRGDPPLGEDWSMTDGGFEYASDLVSYIKAQGDFGIAVAGFPEGHIDCKDGKKVDWQYLIKKIKCGADMVITQMFFDNSDYFQLADFLKEAGVNIPLLPGIIPVDNTSQIKKFSAMCGAKLPKKFTTRLEELGDDLDGVREFGIEHATLQCQELLDRGAPGLHFYTLNKSKAVSSVLSNLNLA